MFRRKEIISLMAALGEVFHGAGFGLDGAFSVKGRISAILEKEMASAYLYNPWFIPEFVGLAAKAWASALTGEKISRWLESYPDEKTAGMRPATIALIPAGNIPMAGLHDLLCILASGNRALLKLSSQDNRLIPAAIKMICDFDPGMGSQITVTDQPLSGFEAVIATGSNNTSRYFDFYFGRYPNIIRKNRNSVAVITGEESHDELQALSLDIFAYFGLGCRNVSKLFIPEGYDLAELWPVFQTFSYLSDHNKYRNNYDYQKAICIINNIPAQDNGFLLLKESGSLISPVSVLNYETYSGTDVLNEHLTGIEDMLQCTVSTNPSVRNAIPPGSSQFPELWDYADGIDTMDFLLKLPLP